MSSTQPQSSQASEPPGDPQVPEIPRGTTLYQANPSMLRNHPVWFFLLFLSVAGWPILFIWWLVCKATNVTITTEKLVWRRGLLSKYTRQVYLEDIREVIVKQTFTQRIFGVGLVGIATSGTGGIEIQLNGIPDPHKIRQIVDRYRRD